MDHGRRYRNDGPTAGNRSEAPGIPGKATLVPAVQLKRSGPAAPRPVQLDRAGAGAAAPADVPAIAAAGVEGGGGQLPHADAIQASFGAHGVGDVRAHVGGAAGAAATEIGAAAYATGDQVAFRETPDLHTAAHEAAHVVQQRQGVDLAGGVGSVGDRYERAADEVADRVVAGQSAEHLLGDTGAGASPSAAVQRTPFDQFGQATNDTSRNLICDLTSPVRVGSQAHYRFGQHGQELWATGTRQTYQWTLYERASGRRQWSETTDTPEFRINAIGTGSFRVEVVVLANGAPSATRMSMDLDVAAEDAALTSGLAGASAGVARTMRELVNDFRQYIIEGANATGPTGITPRMLAGVLFVEVLNRPKEGRESELADVDGIMRSLANNEWVLFPETRMDHSLGVGQIRPATAAMATGATPVVEQDRADRGPARDQIQANFSGLDLATKRSIFAQLQWPKSNIATAARLLAQLKNRPHRYPGLTRAQLVADQTAVGVVATEYNSGGTSTPAASAGPSDYGTWVWNNMQDALIQQFFPNS